MNPKALNELRSAVRGEIIEPGDETYEDARHVYNAMIDRRPRVIVRCVDDADVIACVRLAAEHGLLLSVRGGSHSVPGFGTNDGGMVIDLSRMKGVRVDPAARTALVQGGATWGDFDHASHPFGLHTTGGILSTTGVSGLTLGGGIGYLARAHGLSLDNMRGADVVLASSERVHASATEHPELFWAIRGGGGNFGVVTCFEMALHPVDVIYGGPMFFEVEHAPRVLSTYRDYIEDAPRELGAFFGWQIAPPLPFIPEERHGDTFCIIVSCWNGPLDEGEAALAPFRAAAPVVAEHVGPMPYPALNAAFDALLPPGLQHYWKANFVRKLTDDAIATHLEHGPQVPSMQSTVHIYPINGDCHQVPADATAFGHRDASFATVIAGMWEDPADNKANIGWVRSYAKATAPHSEPGGYINFSSADDQPRVAENYGASFARLRQAKRRYDPGNLFRMNQNIAP